MAFQKVSDLNAETTISLGGTNRKTGKKNPTNAEGYYLGKKQIVDDKKKSGFSYIYFLQTPKGNVGVWGKTDMDRKMGQVKPGTMLRIEFVGMQATKNGEMYKYDVMQDLDNVIPVLESGNANASFEAEGYNAGSSIGGGNEESEDDLDAFGINTDDDEGGIDTTPLVAVKGTTADRAARVNALLGKNAKSK
jgi:hypothetical protein